VNKNREVDELDVESLVKLNRDVNVTALNALAVDVMEDYLGPVVAAVGQTLLRHGELTLRGLFGKVNSFECMKGSGEIERQMGNHRPVFGELSLPAVKSALVNLIRHGIVQLDTKEVLKSDDKARQPQRALYSISARRSLMLLQHPRIVGTTLRNHGAEAACIVEEILMVGSDSREKILNAIALRVTLRRDEICMGALKAALDEHPLLEGSKPDWDKSPLPDEGMSTKDILGLPLSRAVMEICGGIFDKLRKRRVILPKRKFVCKTEVSMGEEKEFNANKKKAASASKTGKRAAPKGKTGSKSEPEVKKRKVAEKVQKSQGCVELMSKFGISIKQEIKKEKKEGVNPSKSVRKRKLGDGGESRSKKKKRPEDDIDFNQDTYWRVNWNYFLQCARAELLCEYFRDKGEDELFPKIVKAVFDTSILYEADRFTEKTNDFELPAESHEIPDTAMLPLLQDAIKKSMQDKSFDMDPQLYLANYLEILDHISDGIIRVTDIENEKAVTIDFDLATKVLKRRCALRQLESEHGLDGLRIVNLLLARGALEEKEIGDMGMVPPKDARSKLYCMLRAGYLTFEEYSRRQDLNPAYTNFLFRTSCEQVQKVVASNVLQAMLNLRHRRRAMHANNAHIHKMYDEWEEEMDAGENGGQEGGALATSNGHKHQNVNDNMNRFKRYALALDKLDGSLLNLQKTTLLLTALMDQPPDKDD